MLIFLLLCTDEKENHTYKYKYQVYNNSDEKELCSQAVMETAGRVLTYDSILTQIWGPYIERNNQILRVNMANVRRKLEKNPADPQYIFTEVGIGYRMAEESTPEKD